MLPITPERLAAVYEVLRAFPPFCRWKLPHSSAVKFHVLKTDKWHADWWIEGSTHHVRISEKKHYHLSSLLPCMGHEMVHMRQRIDGSETKGDHNEEFKRLGRLACRSLGWDFGQFLG